MSKSRQSLSEAPITGWREIRPIDGARPNDRFCCVPIVGDSLVNDGILAGDMAVVRMTFSQDEILPGQLVVVNTPYGTLAKHIYLTLDKQARLVSANPDYEDLLFSIDEIEIKGLIVRIERDFI